MAGHEVRRVVMALVMMSVGAGAAAQPARGSVRGIVSDSMGQGIRDVQLSVAGTDIRAVSGATGAYVLPDVYPGSVVVRARRLGYGADSTNVVVTSSTVSAVNFTLKVLAVRVAGETVTADPSRGKMGPFNERRARGVGAFVTRADIERRQPGSISEMLRSVPGVGITQKMAGEPQPVHMQRSVNTTTTGKCAVLLYVDGHPYPNGSVDDFNPNLVEGLEVYRSASEIPANFRSRDATCGVIALWTRDPDAARRQP